MQLRFGEFELDEGNALLTRDGKPVQLPPKAFALLCALTRSAGRLTRKDELLDAVWGHRHVSESVLKTTVSQLRAALSDDAARPSYIETASRHGYRFIGKISAPGDASAASSARTQLAPPATPAPSMDGIAEWAPDARADIAPRARPTMVGRKGALASLREAWKRAQEGRRELVWIAGDPGVGKTTLLENCVAELAPEMVAFGQCVEQFGAGEPYLPVLEGLGSLCRRYPELPPMLRAIAPTWLVQMPWLMSLPEREALRRDLTGSHPDRMVRELTELIGRFTQHTPLLFVTEDLHWADLATLRVMAHFANSKAPTRVLWIGTFRLTQAITEDHPLMALRQDFRLRRLCTEILLDPFSEGEVGEYFENRMPGSGVTEAFVRRVHAHTDGLPLFVASIVDSLIEQQATDPTATRDLFDAASTASLPVPENLIAALEKQIVRLPADTRAVLEAASVCGMEFRAATVADTLGKSLDAILECCDGLLRAQYWLEHLGVFDLPDGTLDARYAFRHALYKHAFYERLPVAQRVTQHRRVAQSLARSRATGIVTTAAELASHHERGHEYLAALRCYAEAALNALGHFAPTEAAHLTQHAVELLPRLPEGVERMEAELALYTHRGVALTLLHGAGSVEARSALDRVRVLCDILPPTPARAPALNGLGWNYFGRTGYDEALSIAKRLEALALAHPNPVLTVYACNLMGLVLTIRGEHEAACEWLTKGIATCDVVGESLPLGAFLFDPGVCMRVHLAVPLLVRGFPDQARAQLDAGLALAERSHHPMTRMLGHWLSGMIYVRMGHIERVAECATRLEQLYSTTVLPQAEGPSLWLRGWAEAHAGDANVGYEHITQGYETRVRHALLAGTTEALGYSAEALALAQRWSEAAEKIAQTLTMARQRGERLFVPELLLTQARIALGLGDTGAARDTLRASLEEARAQGALTQELKALVALAELPGHTGEDLDALDAAYARIHEGFDSAACVRARELLAARPH